MTSSESETPAAGPSRFSVRELAAVTAIILLGAVVRLTALEEYPSGIHVDETGWGMVALNVLAGNGPHLFGSGFLGESAVLAYLEAASIAILGRSITALRLVAALAGTATLVPLYLLTRCLFGPRAALVSTGLVAGSAAHIHFSRVSMNVIEVPLLATSSLFFVWRGLETGRDRWWLLGGIAAGGAILFNSGGLIVPLVVALFGGYCLIGDRSAWRSWLIRIGFVGLGVVMTLAPAAVYLGARGESFFDHAQSSLLFRSWDRAAGQYGSSDIAAVLWGQLRRSVLAFVNLPDSSSFYTFTGAPLLNALVAPWFVVGLVATTVRVRDRRCALVSLWFWSTTIVAGVLTVDPPQFQRLLPAIVPALLAAVIGLELLTQRVSAGGTWRRFVAPFPLLVAVAAGVYDVSAFFGRHARAYPFAEATAQARFLSTVDSRYELFVIATPYFDAHHPNIRFLAGNVAPRELTNPLDQLGPPPLTRPVAFVAYQPREDLLELLHSLYPGGELRAIEDPPRRRLNTAYLVPAGAGTRWREDRGLTREIRRRGSLRPVGQRIDRFLAYRGLVSALPGEWRPFDVIWRGEIVAPDEGRYDLELLIDGRATLRLDGREVGRDDETSPRWRTLRATMRLARGPHPLEISYSWRGGPGVVELRWRMPDGTRSIVPPQALRPKAERSAAALAGRR